MSAKLHRDVREPLEPRRRPGGGSGNCSPVVPVTIGLVLLIPAFGSVGPLTAAVLLRRHNAEVTAGAALLGATLAASVVLIGAASAAFVSAWRRSRSRDAP